MRGTKLRFIIESLTRSSPSHRPCLFLSTEPRLTLGRVDLSLIVPLPAGHVIDALAELRPPHQINRRQRVGGGHVWPCLLDGPNGKLGLTRVIPASGLSIHKSLQDDVLKVGVHVSMRARSGAKEKPIPFAQNMLRCYPVRLRFS